METNKIYQGNSLDVLKTFPDESIDCVMTSPPYYALRDYQTEGNIWDGKSDCEHDFNIIERQLHSGHTNSDLPDKCGQMTDWKTKDGFCSKCNAWRGNLGLEPNPELFIKHLCDIFDEMTSSNALKCVVSDYETTTNEVATRHNL